MLREVISLLETHLALLSLVALVPYNEPVDVLAGILVDLLHPKTQSVEGLAVSDIVDEHDAMCPSKSGVFNL